MNRLPINPPQAQTGWRQAALRGGGFISGLIQDPATPQTLYARSDVAGIFKSTNGGQAWAAHNNGMTDCHQHDVQSFALSPHDPHTLFRCSGSVRGGNRFGTIHKSTDGGQTWRAVCREIDFYGNGETRQYGEVIAVSPHDSDLVAAGGHSSGLWLSTDGGEHWQYSGLRGERITCVLFHPTEPDTLLVGTMAIFDHDPELAAELFDFVRANPARLYRSPDRGRMWEVLNEGTDFAEIVIDPARPDVLHAACHVAGLQKSEDGGRTWRVTAPALSKYPFGTLALDPRNPQRLFAAAQTFPNFDPDVPPIGLYRTEDGGETWQLVRWHTESDLHNYPDYLHVEHAGWAVAKVRIDTQESDTLYLTNWYGVAVSRDGGHTWDAQGFVGIENVCIEAVVAHPARPDTAYLIIADHVPFVTLDGGRTYRAAPRLPVTEPYPNGTALAASRHRPDLILYALKGARGSCLVRADATGHAPEMVWQSPDAVYTRPSKTPLLSRTTDVSVQALAEDPFTPGTFYAYMDGVVAAGAGLYRSADWGTTWERLPLPFPAHIATLPHQRYWVENELLSVVICQTKNVCGTNQLLCADPHRAGTLYVGEWTEGLFRSLDGGQTWAQIGRGLPFKRDRASVLNALRADLDRPGVLYAGFIREGLWCSTDYGETWAKVYPLTDTPFNASTIAIGGPNRIVVACEPLYYSPCPSGVWVSEDGGATWRDVYDPRLGAIRWKGIALDAAGTRLYLGCCGNSAFTWDGWQHA